MENFKVLNIAKELAINYNRKEKEIEIMIYEATKEGYNTKESIEAINNFFTK